MKTTYAPFRHVLASIVFGVLLPIRLLALDVHYQGTVMGSARAYGVAVSGNHACVAAGDEGFRVFDLRKPGNPRVGECDTRGTALRVAVVGNFAYVVEAQRYSGTNYVGGGLSIIDISDPANPHRVGEETNSVAWRVAVSGDYAYLVVAPHWEGTNHVVGGGLQVIDISNPASPQRVGSFDASPSANLAAVGNFVYIADGEVGLQIVDVSNPASPRRVGNYHGSRDVSGCTRPWQLRVSSRRVALGRE